MLRYLFILGILSLFAFSAFAEEPVYFADPNLKAIVEDRLNINDPKPTDMLKLTSIHTGDTYKKGILSLVGLEYATNLTTLYVSDNQISEISPLSGLTNLRSLVISGNQITDISSLTNLTNLMRLYLSHNQITDISSLMNLTNLTSLDLNNNQITDISSLANLTKITFLRIFSNQISNISMLANLTNLTHLDLDNNQITDISSLTNLTNLTTLYLNNLPLANEAYCTHLRAILDNNPDIFIQYPANRTPPSGVSATDGTYTDKVQITWDPVCSVTGDTLYKVYRSTSETDVKTFLDGSLSNTRYDDTTAKQGTIYYYWIKTSSSDYSSYDTGFALVAQHILTISSINGGIVTNPGEGAYTYDEGSSVPVTAAANTNYHFISWTGTAVDAGKVTNPNSASTSVKMDADYTLVANFAPGQYCLALSSTPGGSVTTPGKGVFFYNDGETVSISAAPVEGYEFIHWSGTATDLNMVLDPWNASTSITIKSNCSIVANFKPQGQECETVYFNDFEYQAGPEWSNDNIDVTPIGERHFLGQFGNDSVTLSLSNLPSHIKVRLTFDLYVIRTWDGDDVNGYGLDLWSLKFNDDTKLIETTFCNHEGSPTNTQSYPDNYPGSGMPPLTGAAETFSLGYTFTIGDGSTINEDSVYNMSFTITDSNQSISFNFAGSGLQDLTDESWGLDNVWVEIIMEDPNNILSLSSTAGGSVTVPGEGDFEFENGTIMTVEAAADPNFEFVNWSGSAVDANSVTDPNSAASTVTMNGDYTLKANFVALSTTLYVGELDPNDPNEQGTEDHPINSIQDAIDVAQSGSIIYVGNGVYKGNILLGEKDISLVTQEPNDPNKAKHPVIIGDSNEPAIYFSGAPDVNCILSGFTIKGGTDGIVCDRINLVINNCIITGNKDYGIVCYDSNATIINCTITGNGGGVIGGALGCWNSNVTLVNCILWNNFQKSIDVWSGQAPIVNYSNIQGSYIGKSNIDTVPYFADSGCWADVNDPNIVVNPNDPNAIWISGDYHLLSEQGRWNPDSKIWLSDLFTSICIDAGDPNSPVKNELLPNGGRINIGAYGGTAEASKTPINKEP